MTEPDMPPSDEADQMVALVAQMDIPGIVDIHTHFMPERMLAKVWAYFDAVHERDGRGWPIAYRHDTPTRLDRLRALGVTTFTALSYPHKAQMATWLNDWAREFSDQHDDCARSATFYPEPDAGAYVEAALASGVQVFKAHLQVGAYDPRDALLTPVWAAIQDSGVPVVIHAGSGPESGPFTGPGPITEVLRRFPRLRLVIAHLGMPEYSAFLDLVERYEGVHLDTTMAFTDFTEATMPFPPAELPRLAAHADRIVFGSDYPNIPYPYLHAVESILALGLGAEAERGILHDNGARLLRLTAQD